MIVPIPCFNEELHPNLKLACGSIMFAVITDQHSAAIQCARGRRHGIQF